MCYAKPGPRCSKHAKEDYTKALATGDPDKIHEAKRAYLHTPDGIKELRNKGMDSIANQFEQRREAALARYHAYQNAVKELKQEHQEWAANRGTPQAPLPEDLYATSYEAGVPEGERIVAPRTAAVDKKRAARDFSAYPDIPMVYGDKNCTSWTTMDEERQDFNHNKVTSVKNPDNSPEGVAMGIHWSKPANGFWSAGADDYASANNGANSAGVPTNWWVEMQSEPGINWGDTTPEEEAGDQHYNRREAQNRTVCVVPREDAAVIRCETREHYFNVVSRYYNPKIAALDYQKMHKDGFDGFSVSHSVSRSGFHGMTGGEKRTFEQKVLRSLDGWDGDSTVWFNKHSFDVVKPHKDNNHRATDADFKDLADQLGVNKKTEPKSKPMMSEDDALADLRRRLLG